MHLNQIDMTMKATEKKGEEAQFFTERDIENRIKSSEWRKVTLIILYDQSKQSSWGKKKKCLDYKWESKECISSLGTAPGLQVKDTNSSCFFCNG